MAQPTHTQKSTVMLAKKNRQKHTDLTFMRPEQSYQLRFVRTKETWGVFVSLPRQSRWATEISRASDKDGGVSSVVISGFVI